MKKAINLRNTIIPVINLYKKFYIEAHDYTQTTRAIIILIDNKSVRLIILHRGKIMKTNKKEKNIDPAVKIADSWIKLIDSGNYKKTWKVGSDFFKKSVKEDKWIRMLEAARNPLGKIVKRTLKSKKPFNPFPGGPKGEFIIIEYKSNFEKKKNIIETITPMKDKDGKWKISGYYIT